MTRTREPGDDLPTGPAELPVTAAEGAASDGAALGGAALAGGADAADPASGGDGGSWWLDSAADLAAETAELIAQIRQLAAHDPTGVQQAVADVMAVLDGAGGEPSPVSEGAALGAYSEDPPSADGTGSVAAEQV
ncbi:MAG TPA: hypothetical protein VFX60_09410 [Micromonospora sp.]|nr:hypothetical protein [Micromonospora sp.]